MRGEHEEPLELGSECIRDASAKAGFFCRESSRGGSEGDGEDREGGGGVGGCMEQGEECRVPLDHGEKRTVGRRVKVGAAACEDAEGKEAFWFGEEQSLQLSDESEMAVLRCAAVKRRTADYPHWR